MQADVQWTDPAGELAHFVAAIRFDDLPANVVVRYKGALLDTLGCLIAAADQDGVRQSLDLVRDWAGKPQARVLVHGDRVPIPNAAFVNGVMGRALDYGDLGRSTAHSSEYIVPALVSAADCVTTSGKELIAAFAASSEAMCRIGLACVGDDDVLGMVKRYMHPPIHQWGVIFGVAKLLGLSADQTWNAAGLGYSCLSSFDTQSSAEGNLVKRMEHGFCCQAGINCVLLAQRGVTGTRKVFLGERGFLAQMFPQGSHPEYLTRDLGTEWMAEFLQKTYSCCSMNHLSIQLARDLVKDEDLALTDIAQLEFVAPYAAVMGPEKWDPKTMPEAQFSLPYCVATGLIKGKVFTDDYTPDQLARRDVRDLMSRIKASADADLGWATHLKLTAKSGRVFERSGRFPPGHPRNPLTWDELVAKFRLCAGSVGFSADRQTRIIDLIERIESVQDVRMLIDLLVLPDAARSKRAKAA
jgi:2-methylcitrate dehydratase PrpD